MPEDRAIKASGMNSKSPRFPSYPNRPVRKLVKIDYETSKVWCELCGILIGYVCVWEEGRSTLAELSIELFPKGIQYFPLISYQTV